MMNNTTLQDYREALDEAISAAKTSGFWTQDFKDRAINEAGKLICNSYRWGFLEMAYTTQSRDQREYYSYPGRVESQAITNDSIYQVNIDGEEYGNRDGRERLSWVEFQKAKNSGEQNRLTFANHNGFYFLYPIPEDGKEISIFGLRKWVELKTVDDQAITPVDLDDAIIKLALAKCLRKAKKYSEAKAEMLEVLDPEVGLLSIFWKKTHEESAGGYKGDAISSRWN